MSFPHSGRSERLSAARGLIGCQPVTMPIALHDTKGGYQIARNRRPSRPTRHAQPTMQPHSGHSGDSANAKPKPSNPRRGKLWNIVVKLIPALDAVAVFTFILAIFTGVQVLVFISSERAFISVSFATAAEKLAASTDPVFLHFVLQNSGKSTAVITDANVTGSIGNQDLPASPHYQPEHTTTSGPVIAGGARLINQRPHIDQTGKPLIITTEILNEINNISTRVFIFGFVEYDDDFSFVGWRGIFGKRITGFLPYPVRAGRAPLI
jgi:hypothetical protein